MIYIKTLEEIELIRECSLLVSKTLAEIAKELKPGKTGKEIDAFAESFIRDNAALPSFKGLYDFPGTLCISINEAVVHGVPNEKEFQNGDVVSIDCGVGKHGFHGDQAFTFAIGDVTDEVLKLLKVTRKSLEMGIEKAIVGNRVGDIGFTIQQYCEREHGYGVVRELVGHGLGKDIHEDPEVPNYGRKGQGVRLQENMVLAIEPMINLGTRRVVTLNDGHTIVTKDRKVSAHYEHDVVVKKDKVDRLTTFEFVDIEIGKNNELKSIKEI